MLWKVDSFKRYKFYYVNTISETNLLMKSRLKA